MLTADDRRHSPHLRPVPDPEPPRRVVVTGGRHEGKRGRVTERIPLKYQNEVWLGVSLDNDGGVIHLPDWNTKPEGDV